MSGVRHRVTIEPLGVQVECDEDQPILDACLRAGIWLPHACTHGTCGTCKQTIVSGEVDHRESSPFALMDFEREEGKALLCSATPRRDVVVEAEVDVEPGVVFYPVEDRVGLVTKIEEPGAGIRRLLLELDLPLRFNPGQYVSLRVPGTERTRSYSIANPPSHAQLLELHVKRTPGGLASDKWIFSTLREGDKVEFAAPFGRFFFRGRRTEPIIMVAGGTGLAPLKSMVSHVLENDLPHAIRLYHGARNRGELYDERFFRELANAHPRRFDYQPVLSDESWEGRQGMVTDAVAEDYERCSGHVAYVCGPPPMVEAAMRVLMSKRLFPKDIYREDFYDESDKASGAVRSPLLKR